MMREKHRMTVSLIAVSFALLLSACAPVPTAPERENTGIRVWPAAPEQARIRFEYSFNRPEDLGIKKGFFRSLGEFFMGATDLGLVRPMAVVESNGIIYVSDPGASGIHRFDTRRRHHSIIRRANNQALPSPVGLARGPGDLIYLTDSDLAQVFVIRPGASFAEPVNIRHELKQPTGIAVDRHNGNLYIADTAEHQIVVLTQNGELVRKIGKRGNKSATFNFPTMLWRDAHGHLLVTDSLNFRIQRFDAAGKFIGSFGKPGDATGYLSRPKGIATDAFGHIYVVDALFHALQIFDQQGTLLLYLGRQGNSPGEFWLPNGIYINEKQTIYIADSHNQRIQVFRYIGKQTS